MSSHVRLGAGPRLPTRVVEEAAGLGAEGLDLAIIYLPPPYDPAVLEPLAETIAAFGIAQQQRLRSQNDNGWAKFVARRRAGRNPRAVSSLEAVAKELVGGDQTLVLGGEVTALDRVTEQ